MGRPEYAQKGSVNKTKGRVGSGLMDQAVEAARKRNAELADIEEPGSNYEPRVKVKKVKFEKMHEIEEW